jgi:hypothetical protein
MSPCNRRRPPTPGRGVRSDGGRAAASSLRPQITLIRPPPFLSPPPEPVVVPSASVVSATRVARWLQLVAEGAATMRTTTLISPACQSTCLPVIKLAQAPSAQAGVTLIRSVPSRTKRDMRDQITNPCRFMPCAVCVLSPFLLFPCVSIPPVSSEAAALPCHSSLGFCLNKGKFDSLLTLFSSLV